MTLEAARLTFRLHRFVVVAACVGILGLAALALWYVARLDASAAELARCNVIWSSNTDDISAYRSCDTVFALTEEAGRILGAMGFMPLVAGLFLAAPIVAQELDRSTTQLAWSLEPSRWRWLAQRLVPILVLAVVLALVAGYAADRLEGRLFPDLDPQRSFHDYYLRGWVLAGRLVVVLGCGVLVGAIIGRTLPALIVGLVIATIALWAVQNAHAPVLRSEATVVPITSAQPDESNLLVDAGSRLPNGEDLTYDQLVARYPTQAEMGRVQDQSTEIMWLVPGARYGIAVLRETLAGLALGLAFMGAAGLVTVRRRPDAGRLRLAIALPRRGRRRVDGRPADRTPGIASQLRLALWPHRVEIAAGVGVGLVLSVGAAALLVGVTGLSAPYHCILDRTAEPVPPDCATTEQYLQIIGEWGGRLFASMAVVPWLVGALIGVVIVGREIDSGSATLAWSLSPDRKAWLLRRVVVAGALVLLLLVVPSVAASEAERIVHPWDPPDATFDNYALRGHIVLFRGLAAFSIALLLGAYLGRVLPAFLVAGVASVALVLVLGTLWPFGVPVESRALGFEFGNPVSNVPLRDIELRECLFLAATSLAFVGATVGIVERRRPY